MAVIQSGASVDLLTVDPAFKAARTSIRPLEPGALGAYSLSVLTGTMAAGIGANSEWFQFRWTDATRLCVITRLVLDGVGVGTAFAAGFFNFTATIARSFSVAGTGGTAATMSGDNQNLRTSFGASLLGEARIATTAALGAGTKNLDSQPVGQAGGGIGATSTFFQLLPPNVILFGEDAPMTHPIVLTQNEGIIFRATVPGTGTWQAGASIRWTEMAAF